jgi:hypothetical protein
VPAPEAGHVLESPDEMVRAARTKQKQIQDEGGGTFVTVSQDEPTEQAGIGAIGGIVKGAVPSTRNRNMSLSPK